jgi:hypothetical protein
VQRLLNIILVAAIAVVGWRVYTTWSQDEQELAPHRAVRPPADLPPTARTPAPARLQVTIVERDLFDESRRAPAVKSVEAEPAAPLPPPDVELVGVLMVDGDYEALIREAGQAKPRYVVKGDDVSGYTVAGIAATEVTLTSPDGEAVSLPLRLKLSGASAGGAAGPAGAPVAPQATAAGPAGAQPPAVGRPAPGTPADAAASVRERLRELRRKRREQANIQP